MRLTNNKPSMVSKPTMTLWLIDDIAFALFVEEVTQLDEAWRGKSFGNMKKNQ